MRRRNLLAGGVLAPVAGAAVLNSLSITPAAAESVPFDGSTVRVYARDLAAKPYQSPPTKLPDPFSKITYDRYRDIRFDPGQSLWRGKRLPFEVQFFHRGFLYKAASTFTKSPTAARPRSATPRAFNLGDLPRPSEDIGFAGFRLHAAMNRPDYFDEICSFLGASYFRAVGEGSGLRALGARPRDQHRRAEGRGVSRLPGLLDRAAAAGAATRSSCTRCSTARAPAPPSASPSAPGEDTRLRRRSRRLSRASTSTQVGLAPLTSMFFFGPNGRGRHRRLSSRGARFRRPADLDRPGRALWRPLANPHDLQVSAFMDDNPRGFGLMQRRARLRKLPGPRSAVRAAAEPVGRADRRLGRGRGAARRDPDQRERSTTTSSPIGDPKQPLTAGARISLHLPTALVQRQSAGPRLRNGSRRPGAVARRCTAKTRAVRRRFVGGSQGAAGSDVKPQADVTASAGESAERGAAAQSRSPAAGGSASSSSRRTPRPSSCVVR